MLAAGLASQVSSRIGKLAGLSSLTIDPNLGGTNGNPSARVAIQQRVTRNFIFTFSTDVTQPQEEIVQGEYQLSKRWSVAPRAISMAAIRSTAAFIQHFDRVSTRSSDMESSNDNNFWVFRDGRKTVSGERLLAEFVVGCKRRRSRWRIERPAEYPHTSWRVGGALSDAASDVAPAVAAATDALAGRLYGAPERIAAVAHTLELTVPEHLDISPPEGFCYYALHPSDFGRLALRVGTRGRPAAVIGVRSIGTTLSAVVSAATAECASPGTSHHGSAEGHPYNRVLQFTGEQLSWVQERRAQGCTFFVVDEGPGRSGSTFLAVGEALLKAGVDVDRISLLGSRRPGFESTMFDDAARRWSQIPIFGSGA